MRTILKIALILFLSGTLNGQVTKDYFNERVDERRTLVYKELVNYSHINIYDKQVLKAMFKVPRHAFVPSEMQPYAYQNSPLPIGYNQTISQPIIVASMTQLLNLKQGMKVLEVGTGSGYQAAILAEMGCQVFSVEIIEQLAQSAAKIIQELGYSNIKIKSGDGYEGWPEHAPFDRIIVTCAPEDVPEPLKDQLKPDGKIVIPVGKQNEMQYLFVIRKNKAGKLIEEVKYPVRFVPMTGKADTL